MSWVNRCELKLWTPNDWSSRDDDKARQSCQPCQPSATTTSTSTASAGLISNVGISLYKKDDDNSEVERPREGPY